MEGVVDVRVALEKTRLNRSVGLIGEGLSENGHEVVHLCERYLVGTPPGALGVAKEEHHPRDVDLGTDPDGHIADRDDPYLR